MVIIQQRDYGRLIKPDLVGGGGKEFNDLRM